MKKIICFGASGKLKKVIGGLELLYEILFVCDNNSNKWGKMFEYVNTYGEKKSLKICPPNVLENYKKELIIITTSYGNEIYNQLKKMGLDNIDDTNGYININRYEHRTMLMKYVDEEFMNKFRNLENCDIENKRAMSFQIFNDHYTMPLIVENILPYFKFDRKNKEKRILDFGFGFGQLCTYLRINGFKDVWGVDIDKEKLNFYNKKIEECGFPDKWKNSMLIYDGEFLPFSDENFDVIFSDQVIEHVQDIKNTFSEMLRVLKTGGFMHIACPNYDYHIEAHYGIDLKKKLRSNKDEFREKIKLLHGKTEELETLNFINYDDIYSLLMEIDQNLEIIKLPSEDYSIDIMVKKLEK